MKNNIVRMLSSKNMLIAAVVVTLTIAVIQYQDKMTILNQLHAGYERSYNQMIDKLNNIQDLLSEVTDIKISSQQMGIFAEIWKEADSAKNSLSLMPYDQNTVNKCTIFLSEVISQSYNMMKKAVSRTGLNNNDFIIIDNLLAYTKEIKDSLSEIEAKY